MPCFCVKFSFWNIVSCNINHTIRILWHQRIYMQRHFFKKSRHSQKSHEMSWNIIVYPFSCLSWSILTQRDKKGYWVTDSRWCVRVLFLFMTYICPFIFTFMAYSPPYFSVYRMMIISFGMSNDLVSNKLFVFPVFRS